ncbi:hypothetical protein [Pseudomaricurvus alkylphenolicus]|uniref:hypothetical protein n=1 Tax=Pseudomaricurvus alkylphenolicus TaxID=1306991 RepID=UPI001981E7E5|nr:hypothetical protein [Pseudomaricurvus alkylphenolicus]
MIDFGDYVEIEQKRYGTDNEMFVYKVVRGGLRCNYYKGVPVDARERECRRGDMVEVVQAICCGVDETKVDTFRLSDVRHLPDFGKRENQAFTPGA